MSSKKRLRSVQRAVARYNLGLFNESVRDCHEALEINPYHFVAATSMGHCKRRATRFAIVSALRSAALRVRVSRR